MNLSRIASALIVTAITVVFLIYAKDLLIPFVLAVFIWFIIREIRMFIRRNRFIREKIPTSIENVISSLILFTVLGVLINILLSNINHLSQNMPLYESNINKVGLLINETFKIDILKQLKDFSGGLKFSSIISEVLNSVSSTMGNVFIILIYILFLLLEESGFSHKINKLFKDPEKAKNAHAILKKIDHSIGRYLSLKTLVSFLTGFLSFVVLKIIGVDAPIFWAFLIFALNYIPTIGSLIATIFPASFAMLQFGELAPALWVICVIGVIQILIGNLIEPKVMGNSLNLSSLVVILGLSLWGAIWGIVGMVLSVPITVTMVILFAEFEETKPIAILLSEKGEII